MEPTEDNKAAKLTIADWAEDDRPREKLARLGAAALSNAELLAILIGSGSTDESAVGLMKRVLSDCNNNLNTLGKRTIADLTRYKAVYEEADSEDGERYSFRSEYVDIDFMFEAAFGGAYVYEDGRYVLYEEGKTGERFNIKAQYVYRGTGSPSDMQRFEAAPSKYWDFANDRVTKDTTLYAH